MRRLPDSLTRARLCASSRVVLVVLVLSLLSGCTSRRVREWAGYDPSPALVMRSQERAERLAESFGEWSASVSEPARLMPASGHHRPVRDLAFSPDSRYIVTGSDDGSAIVWEVATRRAVRSFGARPVDGSVTGSVSSVDFSPCGRYVLTAGDSSFEVWELASGRLAWESNGGTHARAAFGRDWRHVFSSSSDGPVRLFVKDQRPALHSYGGNRGTIRDFDVSSRGGRIVGVLNGRVTVWPSSLSTWTRRFSWGAGRSVAFAPDPRYVASFSELNRSVWVFDVRSGRTATIVSPSEYSEYVSTADGVFSGDGRRLFMVDTDGTVHEIDIFSDRSREIGSVADPAHVIRRSFDDRLVAGASEDGSVIVWDLEQRSREVTLRSSIEPIAHLASASSGPVMLVATGGGTVTRWNAADGAFEELLLEGGPTRLLPSFSFEASFNAVSSLAVSSDERYLAYSTNNNGVGGLYVHDRDDNLRRRFPSDGAPVHSLSFSADGSLLAGAIGGRVAEHAVWDTASGRRVFARSDPGFRSPLVLTDDGSTLLAAFTDEVRAYSIADESLVGTFAGHDAEVLTLASRGDVLVSATRSGEVAVWSLHTREMIASYRLGHPVDELDVSPDGRLIAAAGGDAAVLLNRERESREELNLGHLGTITGLSFADEGRLLVSADRYGVVSVTNLSDPSARYHVAMTSDGRFMRWSPDGAFAGDAGLLRTHLSRVSGLRAEPVDPANASDAAHDQSSP